MADAAQSFGAQLGNKKAGNIINMSTTSFFPSKPLGGYGDGGAIFVQDAQLAHKLRSLRAHGAGIDRYEHVHIGINSRLDTLQAAILLEKLKIFPQELQRRQQIAQFYTQQLQNWIQVPLVTEGYQSAWAIYTLTCEMGQRAQLVNALKQYQIPYAIYYPKPLHLQPAYRHFPRATPHLVHAEDLAQRVLSIPMHPYLSHSQLEYIVYIIQHALSVAPQSLEPLTAKLIG
jgi:dTDP-4-amino-4,6-dideoxygalactose transaminase